MSGGPLPASAVCKKETFWNHVCGLALFRGWSLRGAGCLHHFVSVFHGPSQFTAVWLLLITYMGFLSEMKPVQGVLPFAFKVLFHQGNWPKVSRC